MGGRGSAGLFGKLAEKSVSVEERPLRAGSAAQVARDNEENDLGKPPRVARGDRLVTGRAREDPRPGR